MTSTLDELVTSMNGKPSTDQWDVVCSYKVDKLNEFLQASYDAGKQATTFEQTVDTTNDEGDPITLEFHVEFGSPKLSFLAGQSGTAILVLPIKEGSYCKRTPESRRFPNPIEIPETYSLQIVAPLATVNGTTGEIIKKDSIITFSDHDETNHVIIHFNPADPGVQFKVIPDVDELPNKILQNEALPSIKQHFVTREIDDAYAIASVNNTSAQSAGETIFTPKSFTFASMGNADDGVLSLFIQTAESGNDPGTQPPVFHPDDTGRLPIPDSYTASIILSNSLMQKWITKQLAASGFSAEFLTSETGLLANLKKDCNVVSPPNVSGSRNAWGSRTYDSFSMNLNDQPLKLSFEQGRLCARWTGKTTANWSELEIGLAGPGGSLSSSESGSVEIDAELKEKRVPLELTSDDASVASISFSPEDFTITPNFLSATDYEDRHSRMIPDYYNHLVLTVPTITLALHGFNFFLMTNLIAPGEHVITVDAAKGVQTPHDFLIVGNLAKKNS